MIIKVVLGKIIYKCFAQYLPCSSTFFGVGKRVRGFCGKLMLSKCGHNINIERKAEFSTKLEIGDNSGIGINSYIQGKCIMGNDVMMGPDCMIYTTNHNTADLNIPMNVQGINTEKEVLIGDDVWIGARSIILPGVVIGSHSIIGAGSVVTKDVPEYSVIAGNPAKIKKTRKTIVQG